MSAEVHAELMRHSLTTEEEEFGEGDEEEEILCSLGRIWTWFPKVNGTKELIMGYRYP